MTDRALDEEDELELVLRYKLGQSTLQLAERFGTTETSIRRTLDRRGVQRRPRQEKVSVTPEQVAEARRTGMTWAQVAEWAGCSVTTARNRWKEADSTGS